MSFRPFLVTLAVLAAVGLAGVLAWGASTSGNDEGGSGGATAGSRQGERKAAPDGRQGGPNERPRPAGAAGARDDPPAGLEASNCPPELSNCVVASGRVIYVEAVDPDGDGDAHFVTSSRQGVTLPGITIFDVKAGLRPDPLPGVGDLVGGAGPVYPGSRGQKQIEVIEFKVAR